MVFDIIWNGMMGVASTLFSWLGMPEMLEQPLISNTFSSILFLAAFFIVPVTSIFLEKRRKLMLFLVGFAVSVLFGSIYLAIFSLILQSLLYFVIWFRFRREGGFGDSSGFDEPSFDDKPKMDEPSFDEPLFDEPKLDEPSFNEPSFGEPTKPAQPTQPVQPVQEPVPEYSCPKCGNKLDFIPQYKRYYCYTCKKYV